MDLRYQYQKNEEFYADLESEDKIEKERIIKKLSYLKK